MRTARLQCKGWLVALIGVLVEVSVAMDLPPHPRLLLNRGGIAHR
jgi:hypothetical protein